MDQNTSSAPVDAAMKPVLDSVGTLLQQTWKLYIDRFINLALVMLVPGLLGVGLSGILGTLFVEGSSWGITVIILAILGVVALAVVGAWAQIALAVMISAPENMTLMGALKTSFNKIISYFWISCLAGLVVLAGVALFILPGIFLAVTFVFTTFLLVNENVRGRDALAQSYAYVTGNWWPVFGRVVVLGIIVIIVSGAAALIPGGSQGEVGSLIGNIITMPFMVAYMYVLYKNIKAVKTLPAPEILAKKKKMFTIFAALGVIISIALIAGLLYMAALFMVFGSSY